MLFYSIVLLISIINPDISITNDSYWIKAGDRAYNNQQVSQSIELYTRAIQDNSTDIKAYLKRSKAYRANGQFLESAADMQMAYKLNPDLFNQYMRNIRATQKITEEFSSLNFKQQTR